MHSVRWVVIFLAGLLTGCGDRDRTIMFELPADFRGQFVVVKHPEGKVANWSKGVVVLVVPTDGVVRVKDFRMLEKPHTYAARWSTGERLADEWSSDAVSGVMLCWPDISPEGHLIFDVVERTAESKERQ